MRNHNLKLSVSVHPYDRVQALIDGRVQIEGCDAIVMPMLPEETFNRAFMNGEFDVCELSMSTYLHSLEHGGCPYVAVPAFVSRVFRHSSLYIRTDRGIHAPGDLRGKRVGVPEYQMTAALWVKGMLSDVYGVRAQEIRWRNGGLVHAGRVEKIPLQLPPGFDVEPIPVDRNLSDMLETGDLDALLAPRLPPCFARGAPNIARLFPDFRAVEKEYFRQTGLFPIMHMIGVRKDLVQEHPWLPTSVYKAFLKAKQLATEHLDELGVCELALPWVAAEVQETRALMGHDYWPYGVEANRKALEAMVRYSNEQGLLKTPVPIESLFAKGTQIVVKI